MEPTFDPPGKRPVDLLRVPLSISFLITSPIRTDLPLSPVGAFIVPLVESNIFLGSLVIAALNLFVSFLMKCHLVCPPCGPTPGTEQLTHITMTMPQLMSLLSAYSCGKPVDQYLKREPGSDFGPTGTDEPLFPDNLSIGLMIAAPFADFDGSPDTSLNVPLFEIPGVAGGLFIALMILLARYIVEQGGLAFAQPPDSSSDGGPAFDVQSLLRFLANQGLGR